jgi:hypothetical protein
MDKPLPGDPVLARLKRVGCIPLQKSITMPRATA